MLTWSRRGRWLLAALIAVGFGGLSPVGADDAPGNTTAASAAAEGLRATVAVPGFLIVEEVLGGGGPVSQALVDPVDSRSFASFPYPGETALAGPGLIAGSGGPSLPSYPLFVAASTGAPEQSFTDPAGAVRLTAKAAPGSGTGDAAAGPTSGDAATAGSRTLATVTTEAGTVTATAESFIDGLTVGAGALRVARVRSRSVTISRAGNPEVKTELAVDGGVAGGLQFAYGPGGLVVSNGTVPVPAGEGLAALNQALAPAGLSLRLFGPEEVTGGASAAVLEINQETTLPTGAKGVVRYRLGRTTTTVTPAGAALPAPDVTATPPTSDPTPVATPSVNVDTSGNDAANDSLAANADPASAGAYGAAAGGIASAASPSGESVAATDAGSGTGEPEAANPVADAPPELAAVFPRRSVRPLRTWYALIGVAVGMGAVLYSLWTRRGALTP